MISSIFLGSKDIKQQNLDFSSWSIVGEKYVNKPIIINLVNARAKSKMSCKVRGDHQRFGDNEKKIMSSSKQLHKT